MDRFEQEHRKWLDAHLTHRSGERKRRLRVGHAHAEAEMLKKVWMPAFGHFQHLHPEYEVRGFLEGRRFLDFAYIRLPIRIAIEVDGYGPHQRDISRRQFCDERIRQMHLTNDKWIVIRIGYDDLIERPKVWQQLLLQFIGRLFGSGNNSSELYSQQREIVRLALRLGRPLKLQDVQRHLCCGYRASRKWMHLMEQTGIIQPVGGGASRAHAWQLAEHHPHISNIV